MTFAKIESIEVDRLLKRIENRGSKTSRTPIPRLLRVAFNTDGFRDVIDHFKQEEGQTGKWRRRARSTQEFYAAMNKRGRTVFNPSNKLLQLTGKLRQSLLPTNVRSKGSNSIVFFSTDKKSGVHDRGSSKKNIPKRQFMWMSKKGMGKMIKTILKIWSTDARI